MFSRLWREYRRHRAVQRVRLEHAAEPTFDRLAETAAEAFDAPIAMISLIDRDTLWVKAAHGLSVTSLPRCDVICSHALDSGDVLETCAPADDPRFGRLPVVLGSPGVRYYIGATLQSGDGLDIGTLCILDTKERAPASPDQRAYLRALARKVSSALELRPDLAPAFPRS